MKVISIVFSMIFSINSIFYYLSVNISLIKDKAEAAYNIFNLKETGGLVTIKTPLTEYADDQEHEIWNNGKLYDIVKKELINDTVYTYALPDQDEQDVLVNLKVFLGDGYGESYCTENSGKNKCRHFVIDTVYVNDAANFSLINFEKNKPGKPIEAFVLDIQSQVIYLPPDTL